MRSVGRRARRRRRRRCGRRAARRRPARRDRVRVRVAPAAAARPAVPRVDEPQPVGGERRLWVRAARPTSARWLRRPSRRARARALRGLWPRRARPRFRRARARPARARGVAASVERGRRSGRAGGRGRARRRARRPAARSRRRRDRRLRGRARTSRASVAAEGGDERGGRRARGSRTAVSRRRTRRSWASFRTPLRVRAARRRALRVRAARRGRARARSPRDARRREAPARDRARRARHGVPAQTILRRLARLTRARRRRSGSARTRAARDAPRAWRPSGAHSKRSQSTRAAAAGRACATRAPTVCEGERALGDDAGRRQPVRGARAARARASCAACGSGSSRPTAARGSAIGTTFRSRSSSMARGAPSDPLGLLLGSVAGHPSQRASIRRRGVARGAGVAVVTARRGADRRAGRSGRARRVRALRMPFFESASLRARWRGRGAASAAAGGVTLGVRVEACRRRPVRPRAGTGLFSIVRADATAPLPTSERRPPPPLLRVAGRWGHLVALSLRAIDAPAGGGRVGNARARAQLHGGRSAILRRRRRRGERRGDGHGLEDWFGFTHARVDRNATLASAARRTWRARRRRRRRRRVRGVGTVRRAPRRRPPLGVGERRRQRRRCVRRGAQPAARRDRRAHFFDLYRMHLVDPIVFHLTSRCAGSSPRPRPTSARSPSFISPRPGRAARPAAHRTRSRRISSAARPAARGCEPRRATLPPRMLTARPRAAPRRPRRVGRPRA